MHRDVLLACWPYLALIVASAFVLALLGRLSGARWQWRQLAQLPQDERGGVQSLSFVLTLPLFVMILMFIVQLSQITIATVVVEYAAFAAARSAMVWIPAETAQEYANQIGSYRQMVASSHGDPGSNYAVYQVDPAGPKYEKIHFAAAMACLPLCPSRETGVGGNLPGMQGIGALQRAYQALSPASAGNTQIPTRLANKLAYALASTRVEIELHHPTRMELGADAPLQRYQHLDRDQYPIEFTDNEFGWQDQLYVTVHHDFALLPGPGRLLARRADARPGTSPSAAPGTDAVAQKIARHGDVYYRTVSATVRLNNEGQKSSLPYYQALRGVSGPSVSAGEFGENGNYEFRSEGDDGEPAQDAPASHGDEESNSNGGDRNSGEEPCCGDERQPNKDAGFGSGNREGQQEGSD